VGYRVRGKGVWKRVKEKTSSGRNNNASEGVDENVWKVPSTVTDKEVIDLFQDGLYHRRTFEDFGRRRPKSIPHLKDMITSWGMKKTKPTPSMIPSVARASRTRAAAAATMGTKAVVTITTTRVPIASASQTTLSQLSNALRRRTRRRPLADSKTC
jgi:hypothetical protein